MEQIKQLLGNNARQFALLGVFLLMCALFQWLTGGRLLETANLINIVNGNSYVLILAIGMVLVIIAGHIDLSVGWRPWWASSWPSPCAIMACPGMPGFSSALP